METPRLEADLIKVRHNARVIVNMCSSHGIEVAGVTKGAAGDPEVARAMLAGGVSVLADSRIINLKRIQESGIQAKTMLIRIPRMSRSRSVVKCADYSLNSEWKVMKALAQEKFHSREAHGIILMIDVGDLREGVMHTRALHMAERILRLGNIHFRGIGTNVGCYGGVLPTVENMSSLVKVGRDIERHFGITLETVSVGGTNCLHLIKEGKMPRGITQIRVGEGILLGWDSSRNVPVPDTYQDAFRLVAEIVEVKEKPSKPIGRIGADAFGKVPQFIDRGVRNRAIIALGKQDVRLSGLKPIDEEIKIMGGSSDHIILDVTDSPRDYKVGEEIAFYVKYPGLLSAVTSPYIYHYTKEDARWISA